MFYLEKQKLREENYFLKYFFILRSGSGCYKK